MTKLIYEQGGMRQFWKGSLIISLGCGPAHAAFFTIYECS
jgi:hypothetical protein